MWIKEDGLEVISGGFLELDALVYIGQVVLFTLLFTLVYSCPSCLWSNERCPQATKRCLHSVHSGASTTVCTTVSTFCALVWSSNCQWPFRKKVWQSITLCVFFWKRNLLLEERCLFSSKKEIWQPIRLGIPLEWILLQVGRTSEPKIIQIWASWEVDYTK